MPFILPSLSRAPDFANTRKVEDGTIKDPAESGYVATRPRFTRLRRVFGVSYKYLSAEDVRALDFFECLVVKGMAGSFYLPNQLPNGSFELPGVTGAGVLGWDVHQASGITVSLSSNAWDGARAFSFSTAGGSEVASIAAHWPVSVTAGESYQVCAHASLTNGGASLTLAFALALVYADGSAETLTVPLASASTAGYQPFYGTVAIPASPKGGTAAVARASFTVTASGAGGGAVATLFLDGVGMALCSPVQAYGRMPGSQPLGRTVRFTKGVSVKDAGWLQGSDSYDVSFEVTEV